jgi:hypothetical protein
MMFESTDILISNFYTQCDEFIDKLKQNEDKKDECNNN